MTIHLNLGIDPDTGSAYIWDKNGFGRKPFVQGEHVVPERFRKYLVQRGPHFHSYIQRFACDVSLVETERFLDGYPTWGSVVGDIEQDYWNESDHDGFLEALKWFSCGANAGIFSISWSY